ncbi:MAG: Dabb family protein [Oscillospiraceae bacterium]
MVRHIVMWKFRPGEEENAERFLAGLQGLYGVIPQLKRCEVLRNTVEGNYDAALLAEFDSLEDLEAYKKDPRHVEVSRLCKAIRVDRVAVDAVL